LKIFKLKKYLPKLRKAIIKCRADIVLDKEKGLQLELQANQ